MLKREGFAANALACRSSVGQLKLEKRMKKLLICILCFAVTQSYAQVRVGLEGSFSSLNFWQSQGYSGLPSGVNTWAINGFQGGVVVEYDLGHTGLILQPALLYAENGSHLGNRQGFPGTGGATIGFSNTEIRLYSVRVPVNLLYKWDFNKVRILAGLGPYIAKHVSGTEKGYYEAYYLDGSGDYVTIKPRIDNKVDFSSGTSNSTQGVTKIAPYDIGMDGEVGVQYKKFQFWVNYSRGFTRLYHTSYVNAGNSFWNFTLAYMIFGHDIKPKL